MPQETNPTRVFLPSMVMVSGPPESPWKWKMSVSRSSRPFSRQDGHTYLTAVSAALLEPGAEEDVVNRLPATGRPEPSLASLVRDHLHVDLLKNRRHGGHPCRKESLDMYFSRVSLPYRSILPCRVLPQPATVAVFPTSFAFSSGKHTGIIWCLNITFLSSLMRATSFLKSVALYCGWTCE